MKNGTEDDIALSRIVRVLQENGDETLLEPLDKSMD